MLAAAHDAPRTRRALGDHAPVFLGRAAPFVECLRLFRHQATRVAPRRGFPEYRIRKVPIARAPARRVYGRDGPRMRPTLLSPRSGGLDTSGSRRTRAFKEESHAISENDALAGLRRPVRRPRAAGEHPSAG